MALDTTQWKELEEKANGNKRVYFDESSGKHYLEVENSEFDDYLYFESDENGETDKYLGYTDSEHSYARGKNKLIDLRPSYPS